MAPPHLGRYTYRLVVLRKHHRKSSVVAGASRTLFVYGKIGLINLCLRSDWSGRCYGGDSGGVVTVGSRAFAYQFTIGSFFPPDYEPAAVQQTSCSFMSMSFAPLGQGTNETAVVRLVQQTRDTALARTRTGQVGHLVTALDGRSSVLGTQVASDSIYADDIGVTGWANCYTADGSR